MPAYGLGEGKRGDMVKDQRREKRGRGRRAERKGGGEALLVSKRDERGSETL